MRAANVPGTVSRMRAAAVLMQFAHGILHERLLGAKWMQPPGFTWVENATYHSTLCGICTPQLVAPSMWVATRLSPQQPHLLCCRGFHSSYVGHPRRQRLPGCFNSNTACLAVEFLSQLFHHLLCCCVVYQTVTPLALLLLDLCGLHA